MTDLPLALDPQRVLTPKQRAELFTRADGCCQLCGDKIHGPWIAGHKLAHGLGGETTLENSQVECLKCAKSTHEKDTAMCAKADRQGQRTGQQARRKKRGHGSIQNRGFDKTLTKGFDGKVRPRTSQGKRT